MAFTSPFQFLTQAQFESLSTLDKTEYLARARTRPSDEGRAASARHPSRRQADRQPGLVEIPQS